LPCIGTNGCVLLSNLSFIAFPNTREPLRQYKLAVSILMSVFCIPNYVKQYCL
jgi:hypothetical protein